MKKHLATLLKFAVIAVCFAVLFHKIPLREVLVQLAGARLPWVALAFLAVLSEPVVMAIKWNLLLKTKGINARLPNLIRIIFTSNFLGVAIPTSAGADALRLLMLKGQQHSLTHAASSMLADRVLAVVSLVLLSLCALALLGPQVASRQVVVGVGTVSAGVIACVVALLSPLPVWLVPWGRSLVGWAGRRLLPQRAAALEQAVARVADKVVAVHDSLLAFGRSWPTVLVVLGLNGAIQLLRTLQAHFLFHAVQHPVPWMQELAFVPIIILLTLLPISYFGFGIKEGAFVFFFAQVGVPAHVCLAVSFLTYVPIFAALLPGGYFFLRRPPDWPGRRRPAASPEARP